ncbi:Uncharacterized protein QTN25_009681 [Entamoeba marina]
MIATPGKGRSSATPRGKVGKTPSRGRDSPSGRNDNDPVFTLLNECRAKSDEVNTFQKALIEKIDETRDFVHVLHENFSKDEITIIRDYIPHNDQIQLNTHTQMNGATFVNNQCSSIDEAISNMDAIQATIQQVQSVKMNAMVSQQQQIEKLLPSIAQLTSEKITLVQELEQTQNVIRDSLEQLHIKSEEPHQTKHSTIRSVAHDLEECLNLENEHLLLAYLQSIGVETFCETAFQPEVVLSLISHLVTYLSVESIEIKLSYILLSLKKLKSVKIPKKHYGFFRDIQSTFLSFKELLNKPQYYQIVLMVLFTCEEFLESS